MRALAEFIMRGRTQAVIMALLGSWVPLLSQGALGLVTLRKGWQEGLIITLWASLPAFVALWVGDVAKVMAVAGIEVMFVAYLSSVTLRYTVSWPATLAAIVALSSLAAVVAAVMVEDVSQQLVGFFREFMDAESQQALDDAQADLFANWSVVRAAGIIAVWVSLTTFAGLIVARWWQAMLYNPGGFREEFHNLRLNPAVAMAASLGLLVAEVRGMDYAFWGLVFGMPLLVAGIGLLHCFVAAKKLGTWPLVAFYVGLFFIAPLGIVVCLFGLSDVWIDYRKRFNLMQS
ncbi:hypothetical protein P886_2105 [Alteromonadaceae bacterium 2753L.S.0a.02]|nr:hypothetical protein P886_2105 [Alteromonadaceae bacterium 2753L.S.0a.02]